MNRTILIGIVILSLLGGLVLGYRSSNEPTPPSISGTILEPARKLQGFRLIDHHFRPFNEQSLQGKWTFMFFGYTYCPDICPVTLQVLAAMDQKLIDHPNYDDIQIVFVSVDPQRDNPERLAAYVPFFSESFIGVTGPQFDIDRFTKQLGILHVVVEKKDSANYLVDHSASVLLFNPLGELRVVFPAPQKAAEMADDFSKISAL